MMNLWERLSWDLEWFFKICIGEKPTPARLRLISETLAELREIMLLDDLNDTFTWQAVGIIEGWIYRTLAQENSFDLVARLRALKEEAAEAKKERQARKEVKDEG